MYPDEMNVYDRRVNNRKFIVENNVEQNIFRRDFKYTVKRTLNTDINKREGETANVW